MCVLHNDSGVAMAKGNLVIGTIGPLWDTHVAVQISRTLQEDKYSDNLRYSV
jgi:hypothetical protein